MRAVVVWGSPVNQRVPLGPLRHSPLFVVAKMDAGPLDRSPQSFFSHPPLPPADVSEDTAQLAVRVRAAAAFMARLDEALKGKLGLEEVAALLAEVRGRRCKWAS